jgi:hypothetical protein
MFSSQRDSERAGYLEHVFLTDDSGEKSLVAVIYDTPQGRYKFSCRWKLTSSQDYGTVADCKHDLFLVISNALKKYVDPC